MDIKLAISVAILFFGNLLSAEEITKLDEINVMEKLEVESQLGKELTVGSKLGLTIKETPASVEVISSKTMEERGDSTVIQAVSKAVGIQGGESGHGSSGKYASRGFVGYPGLTFLNDGIKINSSVFLNRGLDIANLDRIEIIKGVSSILNGESSIGGSVNLITKKPSFIEEDTEFGLNIGTYDNYRFKLGVGQIATEDKLAYRLDVSSRKKASNIEGEKRDIDSISTSILYKINDDLLTTISFDRVVDDGKNVYIGTPLIDGKLDKRVRKVNYNVYEDNLDKGDSTNIKYELEYFPTTNLEIKNLLYYQNHKAEAIRPYRAVQVGNNVQINGTDLLDTQKVLGNRFDVLNKAKLFGFENRFLVGFDISTINSKRDMTSSWATSNYLIDIYNPNKIRFGDTGGIYRTKNIEADINQYAIYLEDQFSISDKLKLVAGLRHDTIDVKWNYFQENQKKDRIYNEFSYRTALVYDLTSSTTLYATYSESFENGGSGLANLNSKYTDLDLTEAKQYEVGIKSSFLENKAELALSAYKIEKNNMYVVDPNNANNTLPVGKMSSKGFELSFGFNPIEELKIDANLAYTDAKYDEFIDGTNNLTGKTPNSVPKYIANLGIRYMPISNLGIGTWLRYVDSIYADDKNSIKLPSYTVADLTLDYTYNKNTRFNFIVKNITNELYATSSKNRAEVFLGDARSFEFGVNYKF
ncbi:TonB-dependent siderophore receptor [Aliarcobacter thereius]|uniref:TonB-dependent receptor n=1 Tax=Aliarcobacter thereius TaxID=544718 RepID=UPI0010FE2405|nr:TonB-dependent siderophore receptor [Aliarcobacter thereius]TLT07293.1 TonB-dependent siderophore receptor [Aliarcobacter thereius]